MKVRLCIMLLSAIMVTSTASALPITFIEMESTGTWVMPEGFYYYDDNNSTITGRNSYSNNTYYQNSPSFNVSYDDGSEFGGYWYLNFSTHELGGPMSIGVYDDAVRFPFEPSNTPGLSIYGNGRGNNTLTGSFEVLDIAYSNNTLLSFAATFEQNDSIFGRISYNSEVFSVVPEPSTAILLLIGIFVIGARGLLMKRTSKDVLTYAA